MALKVNDEEENRWKMAFLTEDVAELFMRLCAAGSFSAETVIKFGDSVQGAQPA